MCRSMLRPSSLLHLNDLDGTDSAIEQQVASWGPLGYLPCFIAFFFTLTSQAEQQPRRSDIVQVKAGAIRPPPQCVLCHSFAYIEQTRCSYIWT